MEQKSSEDTQVEISSQKPEQISAPQERRPRHFSKKTWIIIITVVFLIGAIVAAFVFMSKDKTKDDKNNKNTTTTAPTSDDFKEQYLAGCKERKVAFTDWPVPLAQLGYIEPMGKMSDGHVTPTDHLYLSPLNSMAADNTTDVVMPADGTVTSIQAMPAQYIGDRNQQTAPEDHRLIIAHNCQYVSIFIHVHKLSPKLLEAIGGQALAPNTQKSVSLELKAGEKLGMIGGNPVDWSLMDATKTLKGYMTPSLYKGESWKVHVIDPIPLYTQDMQTQLLQKALRNSAPYGGKIDYDKKGALIGNWFRQGTNGYSGNDQSRYWDGHLAIVPDYIDPAATIVSLGNWQGKAAQFVARGIDVKPASVTKASGPVKYELLSMMYTKADGSHWPGNGFPGKDVKMNSTDGQFQGTVMFQVLDGEKLKVELFPGKTAAQISGFTAAAQTYER